jgi:hypothetical protein
MFVKISIEMLTLETIDSEGLTKYSGEYQIASVIDPEVTKLRFQFIFQSQVATREMGLAIIHDGMPVLQHTGAIGLHELQNMSPAQKLAYSTLIGIFRHVRGELGADDYRVRIEKTANPNVIHAPIPMLELIEALAELEEKHHR